MAQQIYPGTGLPVPSTNLPIAAAPQPQTLIPVQQQQVTPFLTTPQTVSTANPVTAATTTETATPFWTLDRWLLLFLIIFIVIFIGYFVYVVIADNALRRSANSLKNVETQVTKTAENIDKAIPTITQAANDINRIANSIDTNVIPRLDTLISDAETKLIPTLTTMATDVETAANSITASTKIISDLQTSLCALGTFGPPFCPGNTGASLSQTGLSASDLATLSQIVGVSTNTSSAAARSNTCNTGFTSSVRSSCAGFTQ